MESNTLICLEAGGSRLTLKSGSNSAAQGGSGCLGPASGLGQAGRAAAGFCVNTQGSRCGRAALINAPGFPPSPLPGRTSPRGWCLSGRKTQACVSTGSAGVVPNILPCFNLIGISQQRFLLLLSDLSLFLFFFFCF